MWTLCGRLFLARPNRSSTYIFRDAECDALCICEHALIVVRVEDVRGIYAWTVALANFEDNCTGEDTTKSELHRLLKNPISKTAAPTNGRARTSGERPSRDEDGERRARDAAVTHSSRVAPGGARWPEDGSLRQTSESCVA